MSFSPTGTDEALARSARVTEDELVVMLEDGRSVAVPLSWYPRLLHGNQREREDYRLTDRGGGIHWPLLDEDIAVVDLLAGRASNESEDSLERWMRERR